MSQPEEEEKSLKGMSQPIRFIEADPKNDQPKKEHSVVPAYKIAIITKVLKLFEGRVLYTALVYVIVINMVIGVEVNKKKFQGDIFILYIFHIY